MYVSAGETRLECLNTCVGACVCVYASECMCISVYMHACVCVFRLACVSVFLCQTGTGPGKLDLTCEIRTRGRTVLGRWLSVLMTLGKLPCKCRHVYTEAQGCSVIVTIE